MAAWSGRLLTILWLLSWAATSSRGRVLQIEVVEDALLLFFLLGLAIVPHNHEPARVEGDSSAGRRLMSFNAGRGRVYQWKR